MVLSAPSPLLTIPEERRRREVQRACEREISERVGPRAIFISLGIFAAWQLVGAGFMLASARTGDSEVGQTLFAAAFAVGYGGAFFSLIGYYVRGRDRGDW